MPILTEVARGKPGLRVLVLYGSRARGDAGPGADWDLAYLAGAEFEPLRLYAQLATVLANDRVDIVDLQRSNALLRFNVARDGRLIFESTAGAFDDFRIEAASFWYDVQHVVRPAYAHLLACLSE